MRLPLGNRQLALVGALLVFLAANAANAQVMGGGYKQPENTWRYALGVGFGMLQTQTQAGMGMDLSGPGVILKLPDIFADNLAVDPKHLRYWHPTWGIAFFKLDGEDQGVSMETDLMNIFFGCDYFRPGKRLFFSGGLGYYAGHHRNFQGTATTASYSTRDFGGWLGFGNKMSPSKKDTLAWEIRVHTLGGDFMPTLTVQYRF